MRIRVWSIGVVVVVLATGGCASTVRDLLGTVAGGQSSTAESGDAASSDGSMASGPATPSDPSSTGSPPSAGIEPSPTAPSAPTSTGAASAGGPEAVPPADVASLEGRTFELVALFSDVGGSYPPDPDAFVRLTFGAGSASAETHCGTVAYPVVTETDGTPLLDLDFGTPEGTDCRTGPDPGGVEMTLPTGRLYMGVLDDGDLYYLSTGYTGWHLREI
jgi:hypothetical protein